MSITSIPAGIQGLVLGQFAYRDDDFKRTFATPNSGATAVIPGYGLIRTATGAALPSGGNGALFCGVCVAGPELPIETASYVQGASLPIVDGTRGIVVALFQDVTPADPVYLEDTTGGACALGGFRKDNDGGKATLQASARWAGTYTAASGVGILTINLP